MLKLQAELNKLIFESETKEKGIFVESCKKLKEKCMKYYKDNFYSEEFMQFLAKRNIRFIKGYTSNYKVLFNIHFNKDIYKLYCDITTEINKSIEDKDTIYCPKYINGELSLFEIDYIKGYKCIININNPDLMRIRIYFNIPQHIAYVSYEIDNYNRILTIKFSKDKYRINFANKLDPIYKYIVLKRINDSKIIEAAIEKVDNLGGIIYK